MPIKLKFHIASPLTKARPTDSSRLFPVYEKTSALQGDRFYFSAVWDIKNSPSCMGIHTAVAVTGALAPYTSVYQVDAVPVRLPHYRSDFNEDYIGHEPGLYPDVLRPTDTVYIQEGITGQLYFEVNVPADFAPGTYPLTVTLTPEEGIDPISDTLSVTVLEGVLPEIPFTYGQWFHYDCLATYYHVEVFSERHWEIVEAFAKAAVKTGFTSLLTPIFTPPLDTHIGGERPTVQLVDVTVENGQYTFGFEKLRRFCAMCKRIGIQDLEIAHFFTQWGAAHAPKIMATANGEYRRIFGWETEASGEAYVHFLRTLIPAVREKLDEFGYKDHYYFHISDEPSEKHLESYQRAKESIWDLISDRPVRDALSHYEFYERGVVRDPIPLISTADRFVESKVPDLWVYYCCGPGAIGSNRFIAMTPQRTRIIGAQMYKAGVTGFLQWGYNFYYNRDSRAPINPFLNTDGDFFAPAGDMFTVYPGDNGTPCSPSAPRSLSRHSTTCAQCALPRPSADGMP